MEPATQPSGGVTPTTIFIAATAAFLVPYALLFITPTFFSRPTMLIDPPVPWATPVASDLKVVIDCAHLWLSGGSPYSGDFLYPPLSTLLFAFWALIGFQAAHVVLVLATVGLFIGLLVGLARFLAPERGISPLTALFLFASLSSYGLQFEFERGQFNVLAMGLSVCGVWLFHARPRWKLLAYGLFSAGIHLKLYPAILGLLLTYDYRDTIGNLRRAGWLAFINVLLLFATGPKMFADFIVALDELAFKFGGWSLNHSIYSFALFATNTLGRHYPMPAGTEGIIATAMLIYLLTCIGVVLTMNWRDRQFGLDPYLLLACTIGAMTIPPISYDYKLAILPPAVALAALEFERSSAMRRHPQAAGLAVLMIMVAAFSITLYSYQLKPTLLDNSCPELLVIVGCVAVLAVMRSTARHALIAAHPAKLG